MKRWVSERLRQDHVTAGFTCGRPELDDWLTSHALRAQHQDTARVYVWAEDRTIVAYYAVAPTAVRKDSFPRSVTGGVSLIPGHLVARLALDQSLHGQGFGTALLLDAIETIVAAADRAGGRLILVDAKDETAAQFYRAHSFRRLADTDRLYVTVAQARSMLAGESLTN
jgi:GNAT superfamily N-acetyltransferase